MNDLFQSGFANILNKTCLMFVWDIFLLHSWDKEIQKKVGLAVLMVIRFWLLRAKDEERVETVLKNEPFRVYFSDLRSAVKHLIQDGTIHDCPQSTNYRVKTFISQPFWDEVRSNVRRDSLVKKLQPSNLSFINVIGKISSKIQRWDSVSSVESEEDDSEAWKRLWTPFNRNLIVQQPTNLPSRDDSFDLYVDCLRIFPQNIIPGIIRVLLTDGQNKKQIVEVLPELSSLTRIPNYNHKTKMNIERKQISTKSFLTFHIYGFDIHHSTCILMGTAMVEIFREGTFNYGGHQIPIRRVINFEELTLENESKYDLVPCLTLLVRLMPASEEYQPSLWYEGGAYQNIGQSPNDAGNKCFIIKFSLENCKLLTD